MRRGSLRARFAVRAMPIAPSAAAKDSWPARKAKHFVSSRRSIAPRLPWPRPTLRFSATEPGMQNACRPMPIASAPQRRRKRPSSARQRCQGVSPGGVLKSDGLHALDNLIYVDTLTEAEITGVLEAARPYSARHFSILAILLSLPSNITSLAIIVLSSFFLLCQHYSSRGSMYLAAPSKRPYWPTFFSKASLGSTPWRISSSILPSLTNL